MAQRNFRLISSTDSNYSEVCGLIAERFEDAFDARMMRKPTLALALTVTEGGKSEIAACMTLTEAQQGSFFVERYLGERAEVSASRYLNRPVARWQIIELGGLAARRTDGSGPDLVSHAPWFLLGLGYRFAIMTATTHLRRIFERLGWEFHPLAKANIEALPEAERAAWGEYYKHNPITGIVDIAEAHSRTVDRHQRDNVIDEMTMRIRAKAG